MIRNYIKIAWRNVLRQPGYSFINIFGLSLGMAVAILIGLWVSSETNHDNYFKDKDQIAQMFQSQTFNGEVSTGPAIPRPLEMVLRKDYNDYFKRIVMSSWQQPRNFKAGDVIISKEGQFMQPGAVEMFNFDIIKGSKKPLDDINGIMLSESFAEALFGKEDPIGKPVKINNEYDLKVTAVYRDIPDNNSLNEADFIATWEHYINNQEWIKNAVDQWGNNSFQLFLQVADGQTISKVSDIIADAKKKNAGEDFQPYNPTLFLFPMSDWYLRSNFENGVQQGGRIQYVWLFAIIGIFVLLLACINFMNLSTARSEKRSKEVGIRKSIGSIRLQLINQFLSESFLIVLLAFVFAILLVLILLTPFNTLADKHIAFPWSNGTFWLISLAFTLFTALLSGCYPALYLSSFEPVKVLKGTFKAGKFAAIPRKALVIVQFTVSVALSIGTLLVFLQIQYSKNRPVGYDREGMVQVPVMSPEFIGKYAYMRNLLLNSGAVMEMSSSSSPTTQVWSNRSGFTWEGKPEGFQEDFAWTNVSYDFAKSLNMKIVAGRDFSREFASDSNAVLINETAAKYMGIENPVGLLLRDPDPENTDPPLKIVGMVQDLVVQSPYEPVKQALYVFDKDENFSYYNLRLNPQKSAQECISTIKGIFNTHFPNFPFDYQFIDQEYAKKFASEERIGKLAGAFTILAIIISCLGLFGLASFTAEQRTKEIGVRKVLGASVVNLWALLSKEFLILGIIALFLAIPLAWYFMADWLQRFKYHTPISPWVFVTASLATLIIILVTVSFQAIKAAVMNPVKTLRSE
ncbi:ABC transporter permease [Marinilongibacter aquaticus]|uniref:ABC transporter permease n=1 Tax=Marinilongibacter aquaticus TaxID=2975157 RepID=UPI0021BD5970|nr:ABC transporter permease [Marinilongibacter aquaticus]UBM57292.1 ABC transporter permease [Marinilongibacter aquaticus]